MKSQKIAAFLLAAILLCTTAASASSSIPVANEYYAQQVIWLEAMKKQSIGMDLYFHGGYVIKTYKLYGRAISDVNPDGSYVLGPWEMLKSGSDVAGVQDIMFKIPGHYKAFAFSFDITWGTDWPYSGVVWNNLDRQIKDLRIDCYGLVRSAVFDVRIDGDRIIHKEECDSHKEWKP